MASKKPAARRKQANTASKKPVARFAHGTSGAVAASVWENEGDHGTFHTVTFTRRYHDSNDKPKYSSSFSMFDALSVARAALDAFTYMSVKRKEAQDAAGDEISA